MSGKATILAILNDRQPHSVEEIEARCPARVTVHSRVADLRNDGWVIDAVKSGRVSGYVLKGQRKGRVRVRRRKEPAVQGYVYVSFDSRDRDDDNVCQIVARAGSETEVLENGPAFLVRFGDGTERVVFSSELRPWYAV